MMTLNLISYINITDDPAIALSQSFIKHYYNFGVDKFYLVLNGPIDNFNKMKSFIKTIDADFVVERCPKKYTSFIRNSRITLLRKKINKHKWIGKNDWIITVDGDEFFHYPYSMDKTEFFESMSDYDYIASFMMDMISEVDHTLLLGEDPNEVFKIPTLITKEIIKGQTSKIPISRYKIGRNNYANHKINIKDQNKKAYPIILPLHHYRFYNSTNKLTRECERRIKAYSKKPKATKLYKRLIKIINNSQLTQYQLDQDKMLYLAYPSYKKAPYKDAPYKDAPYKDAPYKDDIVISTEKIEHRYPIMCNYTLESIYPN